MRVQRRVYMRLGSLLTLAVLGYVGCDIAESTEPSPNFDGTYVGTWSAVDINNAHDAGSVTFTLVNGLITSAKAPGSVSSGQVTASGKLMGEGLFNGHLHCEGTGPLTVTYTGTLTKTGAGVSASGTFADPASAEPNCVASSGPWTATRQ